MLTLQEWDMLLQTEVAEDVQDNPYTDAYGQGFPLPYADMVVAEVRAALQTLTAPEREALSLCFGIDCYALGSYREIGESLGKSGRQVRRLIRTALRKLRHEPNLQMLASDVPEAWDWYGDEESYGVAEIGE